MRKVSYLLASGLLLLGLAGAASAAPGHHRGAPLDRLKTALNLTDDQVNRLKPTFASMQQSRQAKKQAFEAKMKDILTPEQQQQWQASRQNHQRGGLRDLNLSDSQKAEMKTFAESQRASRVADRSKIDGQIQAVLTPEQMQKYNGIKSKMKERRGQWRGGHGHQRPGSDSDD